MIQEIAQPYGEVNRLEEGRGRSGTGEDDSRADFTKVFAEYITLVPLPSAGEVGAHGTCFSVAEEYEVMKGINGVYEDDTLKDGLPKLHTANHAAKAILTLSSATNGRVPSESAIICTISVQCGVGAFSEW